MPPRCLVDWTRMEGLLGRCGCAHAGRGRVTGLCPTPSTPSTCDGESSVFLAQLLRALGPPSAGIFTRNA